MPDRSVLFRTLFEHSTDGVLLTRPHGEILRANPAACDVLRMTEAEIRRRGRDGIVVPSPAFADALALRARSGLVHAEAVYQRGDGTTFVGEFTSVLIPTEGGDEQAYVIFRDITAQRDLARQMGEQAFALAAHRRLLVEALEGSDLGHWDWELSTDRVSYSVAWPALLGFGPDEVAPLYSAWATLVHPDDRDRVNADVVAHLKGEAPLIDTEYRMRSKDGRWRWIQSRAKVAERDDRGRAVRLAGTHADVTRRREAEELLREALAANERLVAELSAALNSVKVLSGLVPVCAWCKRVRSDEGYWQQLEHFISERSHAKFTHGMCPECYEKQSRP